MLYTGFTSSLEKRIQSHNEGYNKSTCERMPLKLVFAEFYLFEEDARKREKYLKTPMGKKAIRFMLGHTLRTLGYNSKFFK